MDPEHRTISQLLALKNASDDVLVSQVRAIGATSIRYMLFDEADRLQHTTSRRRWIASPWLTASTR